MEPITLGEFQHLLTDWLTKPVHIFYNTNITQLTGIPGGMRPMREPRSEDKPIFLSIGYSSCHWCHVMARESFECESDCSHHE